MNRMKIIQPAAELRGLTYTGFGFPICGIFDKVVILIGRANVNLNVAFNAGSSKHGRARRASVGWNCVAATHLRKLIASEENPKSKLISSMIRHEIDVGIYLVVLCILYELR